MSCCSTILEPRTSLTVSSIITDKPFLQTSNAAYTFTLSLSYLLTSSDMVYIYFPAQYVLATGSHTCTVTAPGQPLTGSPVCIVAAGNLVRVSLILTANSTSTAVFTISIGGIQNPSRNPSSTAFKIYTVNAL